MEYQEAYKFLELDLTSSTDEIQKKFKELSKVKHPDSGGSNEEMATLNQAKEKAIEFSSNRQLINIFQSVSKTNNSEIEKRRVIERNVDTFFRKGKRTVTSKIRRTKQMVASLGLISGVFAILTSKIIPNLEIPGNESFSGIFFVITGIIGIVYLMMNFRVKELENQLEDFKDDMEDKDEFLEVYIEIFNRRFKENLSKREMNGLVVEWLKEDGLKRNQRLARLMGSKEFLKLLLLKGEKFDLIKLQEINEKEINRYVIKEPPYNIR